VADTPSIQERATGNPSAAFRMIDNQVGKELRRSLSHICGVCLFLMSMSQLATADETRTSNRDRDALVALENEWLKNEHNAAELEHISDVLPFSPCSKK
jgi:hypothetical protein